MVFSPKKIIYKTAMKSEYPHPLQLLYSTDLLLYSPCFNRSRLPLSKKGRLASCLSFFLPFCLWDPTSIPEPLLLPGLIGLDLH